jgi:hypothetical protein
MLVPEWMMIKIEEEDFIKLRATNGPLIKTICYDIKIPKNPSLTQCIGWQTVLRARNIASGLIKDNKVLFHGCEISDEPATKRPRKFKPPPGQTVTVELPTGPVVMQVTRNTKDDPVVKFNADMLARVFETIRAEKIDMDVKRAYLKKNSGIAMVCANEDSGDEP